MGTGVDRYAPASLRALFDEMQSTYEPVSPCPRLASTVAGAGS